MPSLQTVGRRFESELYTQAGYPFPGVIFPIDEGAVASYDFSEPRFILRVRDDCPVHVGTIISDVSSRHFIMAEHDQQFVYDIELNKTYCLYRCNETVAWEREAVSSVDTLTGLSRNDGTRTLLGNIEVLLEPMLRETNDTSLRVRETRRRLVTSANIQLGDIIDDMIVKRIDPTRGVWMAELE